MHLVGAILACDGVVCPLVVVVVVVVLVVMLRNLLLLLLLLLLLEHLLLRAPAHGGLAAVRAGPEGLSHWGDRLLLASVGRLKPQLRLWLGPLLLVPEIHRGHLPFVARAGGHEAGRRLSGLVVGLIWRRLVRRNLWL